MGGNQTYSCHRVHKIDSSNRRAPQKLNSHASKSKRSTSPKKSCTVKNKFTPRGQKTDFTYMRAPTSKETKKTASGPTTTTLPPHESTHQKGIHTVRNKSARLRVPKIDAIERRAALQNKIHTPQGPKDRRHQKESYTAKI